VDDERAVTEERPIKVPLVLAGAAAWGWRILVATAALALIVFVLIQLYVVVVPVVLALFLAAVLETAAAWLRARRWPPALAAAGVFVSSLGILVILLFWIGASVTSQFSDVGEQLQEGIESAKEWAQGEPLNLSPERVDTLEADLRDTARTAGGGLAERAVGRARVAGEVLGGVVLSLFTLFFILKDGARMADWLRARIPSPYQDDAVALTTRARQVMRQYLIATASAVLRTRPSPWVLRGVPSPPVRLAVCWSSCVFLSLAAALGRRHERREGSTGGLTPNMQEQVIMEA